MARVYTLGHSTRSLDELVALVAEHRIGLVVDVRRYPASRRHPHFAAAPLAAALAAAAIDYRHEPDLGGRRPVAPDSPNTAWRERGFRGYADHMASPEFARALDRLAAAARERPTTTLCAEAVPWRCHRRLISDALTLRGFEVIDVLGPGQSRPHRLHEAARVVGGRLVYPDPAGTPQLALFGAG